MNAPDKYRELAEKLTKHIAYVEDQSAKATGPSPAMSTLRAALTREANLLKNIIKSVGE
jgi:hypothetical protein